MAKLSKKGETGSIKCEDFDELAQIKDELRVDRK
jgi:hypothetical protein